MNNYGAKKAIRELRIKPTRPDTVIGSFTAVDVKSKGSIIRTWYKDGALANGPDGWNKCEYHKNGEMHIWSVIECPGEVTIYSDDKKPYTLKW